MFEKYVYLTLIEGGQEKENHSQQIPTFRWSEWSNLHCKDCRCVGLWGYHLFDLCLKTCKNGTLSLLLIGYFFEHVITFGWREQVNTTSTMPVNHISELKLNNKLYDSII